MSKFIEWYPDLFLQLRKSQVLDDSNIEKLYEALGRYFQAV
jgi:hypothetical protein